MFYVFLYFYLLIYLLSLLASELLLFLSQKSVEMD